MIPVPSSKPYLHRIKITSFGAFSNKVIGPLSPRLNVVYGENEAGKSTLTSFVGGVLFGWEEARGSRNTYKPENAERSGSLFFTSLRDKKYADTLGTEVFSSPAPVESEFSDTFEEFELTRIKNSQGLQGATELIDDLDKETFQTMFALTSDELRSLRNTTDVTAKLLTAGSGTSASPAHALVEVQARLAEYTSRAAGVDHSLVRLAAQRDDLRAQMSAAADEADCYKMQGKEFSELIPQRDQLISRLDTLNESIEMFSAQRASLEKLDAQYFSLTQQMAELREEEASHISEHRLDSHTETSSLMTLSTSSERALRDSLDGLSEEQAKHAHRVELAKENYTTSTVACETLLEAEDVQITKEKRRHQRRVQVGLSVALPLVFITAGVPVFIHGREITSLSFTALGVGLVVFSLMLAAAALVMLFRPDKATEALEARQQDARWVMLQDKKKYEACLAEQVKLTDHIATQLENAGLFAAKGSIRSARVLLDEARVARAELGLFRQRQQALAVRISALADTLADIEHQRARIAQHTKLDEELSPEAIDKVIEQKSKQRAALLETSESLNRRYGELKQTLTQAKKARNFDALKLQYQQVCTRQDESARDYARLLLARRMLEAAVSAWESKSQPEVYRQASRLMALMTNNRWVKVHMTAEGKLQVIDSVKTVREPLHLSLGTCQQLYLALRIALLMTAENVGRSVPIMADDILVNFDARRRVGAVRALAELSQTRQVVLFTCHEEIVESMRSVDPALNIIEL